MNATKIILILLLIYPCEILAQPIEINGDDVEFTQITPILKSAGKIGTPKQTNIKTKWKADKSAINRDGSQFVTLNKLIKKDNQTTKVIDLTRQNSLMSSYQFNDANNELLYWNSFAGKNIINLNFYDLSQEKIINSFPFNLPFIVGKEDYKFSNNGLTVAITNGNYLYLYDKKENEYVATEYGRYGSIGYILISRTGNRVFCFIPAKFDNGDFVYFEKTPNGWTKEMVVPGTDTLGVIDPNDDLLISPEVVATDGKTLIGQTNKHTIAAIHEDNGQWSEPEFIADLSEYVYTEDDGKGGLIIHTWGTGIIASDDGRVVAVKVIVNYIDQIYIYYYDIYVFIKDDSGKWSKHKINPDGVPTTQDILLSGDGSSLLWVPDVPLSGISYPGIK